MKLAEILHELIDAVKLHPNRAGELHGLADEVARDIINPAVDTPSQAPADPGNGAPGA